MSRVALEVVRTLCGCAGDVISHRIHYLGTGSCMREFVPKSECPEAVPGEDAIECITSQIRGTYWEKNRDYFYHADSHAWSRPLKQYRKESHA